MKKSIKISTNLLLVTFYKMLSFDLLFYYAISYLFFVNIKGLTTSQVVFADSFYPLFQLVFQVPCTLLIQKVGKKNSLILANLASVIYGILMLIIIGPSTIIIGNAFLAFSFVIKEMAEPTFLYDALNEKEDINSSFSTYESISTSGYYFLDSTTSIVTGFLYIYNPYLPMVLSLIISIIATILTCCLKESSTQENEVLDAKDEFSTYLKDLVQAFNIY